MSPHRYSTKSQDEGFKALIEVCASYTDTKHNWNEANTRFHFIDRLLNECLGWPRDDFDLENSLDGEYADYIVGSPGKLILEAKKEGVYFELPPGLSQNPVMSLKTICRSSAVCKTAIEQVQNYCFARGIQYAVVCNGPQLIAFVAIRIGEPPLSGQALVINSLDALQKNFVHMWNTLSPAGLAEGRLYRLLTSGTTATLPPKLNSRLSSFPQIRYQSDIQATLRDFSDLLIEDIVNTADLETQFYEECYCDTGALSRDALLSKRILSARYAALFPATEGSPRVHDVRTKGQTAAVFTDEMFQEALARRPIVLIGDVGVGKTSFIKNLFLRKAAEEAEEAIVLSIDFGTKGTLTDNTRTFVLLEIERQLSSQHQVELDEENLVRGVYDLEAKKYRQSIFFKTAQTETEQEQLILGMLATKMLDRAEHLRRVIDHLSKARRKQIVIVLDNADQRDLELQQEAFLIAQEFARGWKALTFISLRPATFFRSAKSGALAAYPNKVFTISPPRPELVIEKRLQFALRVCEGEISFSGYTGLNVRLSSMTLFLKALLLSIGSNKEISELLANITGGNIREIVEFVKNFIGSPNVDAEKIVSIMEADGDYHIPLHEFSKAAILGDYAHYNPASNTLAANLFEAQFADEKEHFLAPLALKYLDAVSTPKDKDGFVTSASIVVEMQSQKFTEQQTESVLRRLTNRKLIETTQRVTFDESPTGLTGEIPYAFRLTSVGLYHIQRWIATFAYLDAMLFDTPIFDDHVFQEFMKKLESFSIDDRFHRALAFRTYLSAVWNRSGIGVPYFDWEEVVQRDRASFDAVGRAVSRGPRENRNNAHRIKRR